MRSSKHEQCTGPRGWIGPDRDRNRGSPSGQAGTLFKATSTNRDRRGVSGTPLWAVEDCCHLSRRLERELLGAGETIVRVPPKLIVHTRDSARTFGKSDPIDALAVAQAALREPHLPTARLVGPDREIRLFACPIARLL